VTYTYDGDGRRVKTSNGKLYWYGMGSDPLDESDLTGNMGDEFIFFGDKRIARRDSFDNVFYYFADHLGTLRVILQAGQTTPCYDADFYPYGGERIVTNTCPQNYKFTSKERDSESGLDDLEARYYSSALGRFITPDWDALPRAVPYADFTNPQSLNLYAYVLNSPLTRADLDGHVGAMFPSLDGLGNGCPRGGLVCGDAVEKKKEEKEKEQQQQPSLIDSFIQFNKDGFLGTFDALTGRTPTTEGERKQAEASELLLGMASGEGEVAGIAKAVRLGKLGAEGAGIVQNTERIESLTGTAKFRVPDELNHAQRVIGEVKNAANIYLTQQMRDFAGYASAKGYTLKLTIRNATRLSKPAMEALKAVSAVIIRSLP